MIDSARSSVADFPGRLFAFAAIGLIVAAFAGCTENTAISHGKSTALDSVDLVEMTDDMTMKILGDPHVQSAMNLKGRLKVVIQPVENRMIGEEIGRAHV